MTEFNCCTPSYTITSACSCPETSKKTTIEIVTEGLYDKISNIRNKEWARQQDEAKTQLYTSPEYRYLVDLFQKYKEADYSKVSSGWFSNGYKTREKELLALRLEINKYCTNTWPSLFTIASGMLDAYDIRSTFQDHIYRTVELQQEPIPSREEIQAKLLLIPDWETKSFDELLKQITND